MGLPHHKNPDSPVINLIDTPGIVSLIPRSQDEEVVLSALSKLNTLGSYTYNHPHLAIVVLDATQPGRHLALLKQIIDCSIPCIVAVTMTDIAEKNKQGLDLSKLSDLICKPVVGVNGRTAAGVKELFAWIETLLPEKPKDFVVPTHFSQPEITNHFSWADSIINQIRNQASHQDIKKTHSLSSPNHKDPQVINGKNEPPDQLKLYTPHFLDKLTLHPVWGLVSFFITMSFFFWLVYWAATPAMDFMEYVFVQLASFCTSLLGASFFARLITEGLITGGGAVLVFVPQIAILFLALGVLEDSGYLARGAMMVDRLLSLLGLNGKSFVPLLSGNACAIPAAMAARTIPGLRERTLTLLIIPLMSCSARLPVWALLLGFLVPTHKAWLAGIGLACIYLASIAFASLVAWAGGKILRLPQSNSGFQLELPQWRRPIWKIVFTSSIDRTWSYLQRAGLTILIISLVFWLIMNLPSPQSPIAFSIGRALEPLLSPMGLDWKVGVALLAAFAAREVFVSVLAVVYAVSAQEGTTTGLLEAMRQATFPGGQPVFTTATTMGLIVFFMIALQCTTTIAVMRREVSNKFALGQTVCFIIMAYILASLMVQGLRIIGIE